MIRRSLKIGLTGMLAAAVVAGCAVRSGAPVVDRRVEGRPAPAAKPSLSAKPAPLTTDARPEFHSVGKGDTLYSIALDHGLDYRELAQWNGITDPGVIRPGQQLRLRPPTETVGTAVPLTAAPGVLGRPLGEAPMVAGEVVKTQPKAVRAPYSDQAYTQMAGAGPEPVTKPDARAPAGREAGEDGIQWGWPARGRLVGSFSENASLKGISIAGKLGQPVLASAAGKVIFSGTGVRGFGKLIVIKHNDQFLSVYGHNRELLVKEGQSVAKGQKIAEMGATDADQVKLHFEIRRYGKPVDPIRLLPPT